MDASLASLINFSLLGSNTPATPSTVSFPSPRGGKRRVDFCRVCQEFICKEGQRSQGPRRHVLQHHLCRPLFFCPHCPTSSNYDKAHITNHMNRIHKDLGGEAILEKRENYEKDETEWMEKCFGVHKPMKNVEGKRTPRPSSSSASTSSKSTNSSRVSSTVTSPSSSSASTISTDSLMEMMLMMPMPSLDCLLARPAEDFPPGPLTKEQLIYSYVMMVSNMAGGGEIGQLNV